MIIMLGSVRPELSADSASVGLFPTPSARKEIFTLSNSTAKGYQEESQA
jgi:hypothetical protein